MSGLRWLAVLPSAGGLAVSLTALTAGAPALAAQDAYGLAASPAHTAKVAADPWMRSLVRPSIPVRQVQAAIIAKVEARREAARDRRQAARQAARAAAREAARAAARQATGTVAASPAAPSTAVPAPHGCPAPGPMGRVDEGVDFSSAGPVYAIGSGTVTLVDGASGWPGGMFIAYRLTGGPWAGNYVYVAEDVAAAVGAGQHVNPSTVVANALGGGDGIETGWAMPPGNIPEAAAYNHYTDGVPTSEGYDFRAALTDLGCG